MKDSEPKKSFNLLSSPSFLFRIGGILGILMSLMAIALPNLLGQVATTRDCEAKCTLGTMNRAQQSYFAEFGSFATRLEDLELPIGNEKFYTFHLVEGEIGLMIAKGIDNEGNGTEDYIAGINYHPNTRIFSSAICIAKTKSNHYRIDNPTEAISNYGIVQEGEVECEKGVREIN